MSSRILVVEDEPAIADNITYALSTEGFEPVWCSTGQEGLECLRGGGIALVVLDVGLPDMDGFSFAREARKTLDTPIIFLTARASEIDRVVGLELGADDYMVKPFSPRELAARIKAVLRRSQKKGDSGKATAHPDFRIDAERYSISYRGEELELSRYEFGILSLLVKGPGRVFTREHLMQLVWETPEMSLERTVDTHIKTIRQKLKKVCPEADPIETHRGIGYSLREEE